MLWWYRIPILCASNSIFDVVEHHFISSGFHMYFPKNDSSSLLNGMFMT